MSIKTKILLTLIILVIVPTIILTSYSNKIICKKYCEQMLKVEKRVLDEKRLELTSLFNRTSNDATILSSNTKVVELLENDINNLISGIELTKGNAFYLITDTNILATSDIQIQIPSEFSLEDLIQNADNSNYLSSIDGNYALLSTLIPDTPYALVSLVSTSAINNSHLEINRNSIMIAIITSCFTCIIALSITNPIVHRIETLNSAMNEIKNGNFTTHVTETGRDEITMLESTYNEMLAHVNTQINDKVRIEQEIKNYEILCLQAQINPNFLNTVFEFINKKALINGDAQFIHFIQSLSHYYKFSLCNNNDNINLAEDLEQVKTYVGIQNYILGNRITLDFLVDDDVLNYCIPKLLLQPMIDNAISHGIRKKDVPSGNITIYGETDGKDVILRVEDNGIGMDYEKVSKLLFDNTSTSLTGNYFGLYNIDQRLKQSFGNNYGLSIRSMKGIGTTVFIKIKAIHKI